MSSSRTTGRNNPNSSMSMSRRGGASRPKGSMMSMSRSSRFIGGKSSMKNKVVTKEPVKPGVQVLDSEGNDVTPLDLLDRDSKVSNPLFDDLRQGPEHVTGSIMDGGMGSQMDAFSSAGPFSRSVFGGSQAGSIDSRTSGASSTEDDHIGHGLDPFGGGGITSVSTQPQEEEEEILVEADLDKLVYITIMETETIWMFEVQGTCVSVDDEEAHEVAASNSKYQDLLKNRKGNDRYMDRSMQTFNNEKKNKDIQVTSAKMHDMETMSTSWDITDSYNDIDKDKSLLRCDKLKSSEIITYASDASTKIKDAVDVQLKIPEGTEPADAAMQTILHAARNSNALLDDNYAEPLNDSLRLVERIIAQTHYHVKHASFRLLNPLPGDADLESKKSSERGQGEEDNIDGNAEADSTTADAAVATADGEDEKSAAAATEAAKKQQYAAASVVLEPSSLPSLETLWLYTCSLSKSRNVTCLAWNKKNPDLIAVGYDKHDFSDNEDGLALCWSLKNPDWPERVYRFSCGVTSLDFSGAQPSLLGIGLHDGTVSVYNIHTSEDKAMLDSSKTNGKHSDPVWALQWVERERSAGEERGETLVSVSTDGRVTQWSIRKGFEYTDLMRLKRVVRETKQGVKGKQNQAFISRQAGGLCFDFSTQDANIYLAGTEDGNIHKCSCSYNEQYLDSFFGHAGPVYKIKWSPFHPSVFISCSADWTLKIWHQDRESHILNLQSSTNTVSDVCWSPHQSTVFGSVSEDRVEIWDLSINALDPIISQQMLDRKLSRVAFSHNANAVITGDDSGNVTLHQICRMPKATFNLSDEQAQFKALDTVMNINMTVTDS